MAQNDRPGIPIATIAATLAIAIAILAFYQACSAPSTAVPRDAAEPLLCSWAYWQVSENGTSRSEVLRNLGLLAAALVGLGFGIWRAWTAYWQTQALRSQANTANEQARIAEQGQITERFTKAVEQLGHGNVSVRIGGLYALKRIAEDSPERDHLAVMDVITNFIRWPPYTERQHEESAAFHEASRNYYETRTKANTATKIDSITIARPPKPQPIDAPDVMAAAEILQARSERQRAAERANDYDLTLQRAGLSYLRLIGVKFANQRLGSCFLTGADLRNASLTRAKLTDAHLTRADLTGADLRGANLMDTDFSKAKLASADLTDAKLTGADLDHADLTDAKLTGADLTDAKLTGADLNHADLTRANLTGADLTDADLTSADLNHAGLTRANLKGTDLSKAKLTSAKFTDTDITAADVSGAVGLTQPQIDQVEYDPIFPPELPSGLTLPAQSAEAKETEPGA